jgi:copper resistance protein B
MRTPTKPLCLIIAASLAIMPVFAEEDEGTSPPWSQADEYYGREAMSEARADVQHEAGGQSNWFVMADRFETQIFDDEEALVLDGQGWYGGDINKLWIKAEAEYSFEDEELEDAEIQALWSRAISPYFDVQAGLRYDLEPKGRTHAVMGIQGLAPYWFEVDAAAFVSTEGDVTARIEAEYELLLTQRLILQPRVEANLSAQDIPALQIGSGLTNVDAGLRLRYEIVREVAPYIGVEWQSAVGDTSDLIEASGGEKERTAFLIGVRTWF